MSRITGFIGFLLFITICASFSCYASIVSDIEFVDALTLALLGGISSDRWKF